MATRLVCQSRCMSSRSVAAGSERQRSTSPAAIANGTSCFGGHPARGHDGLFPDDCWVKRVLADMEPDCTSPMRFDPPPAFVLWLFVSNLIQILLMPRLLVGQNVLSRHAEIRADADYETNLKTEQEVEVILQHLEYQNHLIERIVA